MSVGSRYVLYMKIVVFCGRVWFIGGEVTLGNSLSVNELRKLLAVFGEQGEWVSR